jgi:glycosyltransferase involved in cell wall biosynthesis
MATAPAQIVARPRRPHPASQLVADRRRDVEIVIPVYNEAATLEGSLRRLHDFLVSSFPFTWRIAVADNGSTDGTFELAEQLADRMWNVDALRLGAKGRGRALRAAWSASDARVLCYMDVDLSTDLRALLPLIATLLSGHSDVAIGTRLHPGARVVRGRKRELISRSYNLLLHVALRARFSDAQCGFKAIRADAARELLPEIEDQAWFFDTELLVLAQRRRLRIHEVPVDWVEDADSRVRIVSTALADLRGVGRLLLTGRLVRFALIGVLSTAGYAGLFTILRGSLNPGVANVLALAATAIANTAANRSITFDVHRSGRVLRHHVQGMLVVASALAMVVRYLGLRHWVFRTLPSGASQPPASQL